MERFDDMEHEHICGHALMATCPPLSHIRNNPAEPYPHKLPDMGLEALVQLYMLSSALPAGMIGDAEITPIQAWKMLIRDERVWTWASRDFEMLTTDLLGKVRCYG